MATVKGFWEQKLAFETCLIARAAGEIEPDLIEEGAGYIGARDPDQRSIVSG